MAVERVGWFSSIIFKFCWLHSHTTFNGLRCIKHCFNCRLLVVLLNRVGMIVTLSLALDGYLGIIDGLWAVSGAYYFQDSSFIAFCLCGTDGCSLKVFRSGSLLREQLASVSTLIKTFCEQIRVLPEFNPIPHLKL